MTDHRSGPVPPVAPPVVPLTPDDESHAEHALDEALAESFPASDPVAIAVPEPLRKR